MLYLMRTHMVEEPPGEEVAKLAVSVVGVVPGVTLVVMVLQAGVVAVMVVSMSHT